MSYNTEKFFVIEKGIVVFPCENIRGKYSEFEVPSFICLKYIPLVFSQGRFTGLYKISPF